MLLNITIGCALLILSTFIHAAVMAIVLRGMRITHAEHWMGRSHTTKAWVVSMVVLAMFIATLLEAGAWAATFLAIGAMTGLEQALYFSTVTYTTLGFGDVVMEDHWRLLSSLEAATGIIMFGWTTAVIVATVQHVFLPRRAAGEPDA